MISHDQPIDPSQLASDLHAFLDLTQEVLDLTSRENQLLSSTEEYDPSEFSSRRKILMPRLEESLIALRGWRHRWQQLGPAERAGGGEVPMLFQATQGLLMKVLLLDRENQQALLRRGLVPARHLPAAGVRQPHCVADIYQRNARR
jgi:hypothetical protein